MRRLRMSSRRWSVMLVVLGALLTTLAIATPASASSSVMPAAPGDCKEAPKPQSPMGNPLAPGRPYNASDGDPFAKGSKTTIAQAYGNGYGWTTYDNGCKPGSDWLPKMGTGLANMGLEFPSTWVAWGRALHTSVIIPDNWIGKIDPAMESATKSIAEGFWYPYLPVAGMLVAVLLLVRSNAGAAAKVVTGFAWALLIMVITTWLVSYPTESTKLVDDAVVGATTSIATSFVPEKDRPDDSLSAEDEKRIENGEDPDKIGRGDDAVAALNALDKQWGEIDRETNYRSWLAGTFGDPDSKTAKKYGPRVFKASHFTWNEYRDYSDDPEGKGKKIVERKADEFEKAADEVKDSDPIAYEYLTGNRYMERMGIGATNGIIVLITTAFLVLSIFGVAAAFVVARLIAPFGPAAAPIFMIDLFRNVVIDRVKRVAALLVMGPIYLVVGLVVLRFNAAVMGTGMGTIFKMLLAALVSWLAWKLVKPAALGGHSVGVGTAIRQAMAVATGVRLGRKGGDGNKDDKDDDKDDDKEEQQARRRRSRPVLDASRREQRQPLAGDSIDLGHVEATPHTTGTFVPRQTAPVDAPTRREALALGPAPRTTSAQRPVDARALDYRSAPERDEERPSASPMEEEVPHHGPRPFASRPPVALDLTDEQHSPRHALPSGEPSTPGDEPQTRTWHRVPYEDQSTPAITSGPERPSPRSVPYEEDVPSVPSSDRSDALRGRLMTSGEDVPSTAHEANLTYDSDGRPVFALYRPESTRRATDA